MWEKKRCKSRIYNDLFFIFSPSLAWLFNFDVENGVKCMWLYASQRRKENLRMLIGSNHRLWHPQIHEVSRIKDSPFYLFNLFIYIWLKKIKNKIGDESEYKTIWFDWLPQFFRYDSCNFSNVSIPPLTYLSFTSILI